MASASSDKKSRKRLTLNEKLEIIKLSKKGMCNADIGRKLGLARQSVSAIVNDKEKYLEEVKSATPVTTKTIKKRDSLVAEMEQLLSIWIEDQTSQRVSLSQACIQNKALALFNAMKAERGVIASEETFKASQGWLCRFKERRRNSREIAIPELENALSLVENGMAAFEKIDPSLERSSKVNAAITKAIACYKQLLLEKKNHSIRQTTLLSFFDTTPLQPSTATSGLPALSPSAD